MLNTKYFLFIITLLFTATLNAACVCTNTQDAATAFQSSHSVFKGRVENIVWLNPFDYLVKINVHKSWKNLQSKTIWLGSTKIGKECGFNFTTGHEYLIYSYNVTQHFLAATECGRSKEWQLVSEKEQMLLGDLIYINEDY